MATVIGHGGGRTQRGEREEPSPRCSALGASGEAGTGMGAWRPWNVA